MSQQQVAATTTREVLEYYLSDRCEPCCRVSIRIAQQQLGSRALAVTWLEADITRVEWPYRFYDVWHDRAAFHFLIRTEDRQRYVEAVQHSVKTSGHVIVATFALDGSLRGSGLEVVRYNPDRLHHEFGNDEEKRLTLASQTC